MVVRPRVEEDRVPGTATGGSRVSYVLDELLERALLLAARFG